MKDKTLKPLNRKYADPYGVWEVTTEGDCEGRTVKALGTYTGFVDEIAFHLADKACYGLTFKRLSDDYLTKLTPTQPTVNLHFDIDSNTWDYDKDKLIETMEEVFKNRPVKVKTSDYFASFSLEAPNADEIIRRKKIKKALDKLSDEDIKLLGLDKN